MIVWIEKVLVLAIHDRHIAEHGGSAGMRDLTLLESALARPQQLHAYGDPQPDLADLAASLCFGIARNHPFVDGNKRTAITSCETFIELNGASLVAGDAEIFPVLLALAEGKLSQEEFATWLRVRISLAKPPEIQEPRKRYPPGARRGSTAPAK